jgi:hypothetical protein
MVCRLLKSSAVLHCFHSESDVPRPTTLGNKEASKDKEINNPGFSFTR